MKWHRNSAVTTLLDDRGIKYRHVVLKPADIDLAGSRKNQARITGEVINDDNVFQMAHSMEKPNASFPEIVTHVPRGAQQHVNIDGNNRCAAFDLVGFSKNGNTIGAIQVLTDDTLEVEMLTRSLNRLNGEGQSREEALQHAVHLVRTKPNLTHAATAETFGLKASDVSAAVRREETRDFLIHRGIRGRGLKQVSLNQLAKLRVNENVLLKAGNAAVTLGLTGDQTAELVDRARQAKTEDAAIVAIAAFTTELEADKRPRIQPQRIRHQFLAALRSLKRLVREQPTTEHLQLTGASELDEARRLWGEVKTAVNRALKE